MFKKLIAITMCTAISLSLLSGCGQQSNDGSSASTTGEAANSSTNSKPEKKSDITMMVINSFTKTQEAALYGAIEKFNSSNNKVNVTLEPVPSTNIKEKFTTAALSGAGPDVVSLDNAGWIADMAAMGLLAEIDDKVDSIKDELMVDAMNTTNFKGHYYGIPWYVNNMVMYYNKGMFKQAGISNPPATWQELEDAVKKLKGIGKYGINFPVGSPGGYTIASFFLQNGNPIIDTTSDVPKVVFNNESGVEAFTYITDLYTKYKGMPESVKSTLSWDQVFAPFIQEDVGIVLSGDWAIDAIKKGNPDLDYGIAPLPIGKTAATTLGGYNLSINKNSKSIDGSWEFIKWLSQKEQSDILKSYNRISARKDVVESDMVKSNPIYEVFIKETVNSKSRPVVTQWQQVQTYLGEAFTSVILGAATPQEALDKYAKMTEDLLKHQ